MKTIAGVFAHPDDEAFGPGGTLATLSKDNNVYLICVTNGDAADGKADKKLAEIREKELSEAAKILGVKKVFFLNYHDGTLSNNLYHEVADKIQKILKELKPQIVITFENRGVSGHLDHIAVSMITTFVFNKLKFVKELWCYCITKRRTRLFKDYFIYFPDGYSKSQIQKTVNLADVWDIKLKAMYSHKSQIKDIERILSRTQSLPKEEYFLIVKK